MRAYILGAGFSYHAGYPLANQLLTEINNFARAQGNDCSSWRSQWPKVRRWLTSWWWPVRLHPGLRQAYKLGNVEAVISLLDAVEAVVFATTEKDVGQYLEAQNAGENPTEDLFKAGDTFRKKTRRERVIRTCLEEALIEYFEWKNKQDSTAGSASQGTLIHKFCKERLRPSDAVISFNYDCSLERAILQQGRFAVKYVENWHNIQFLVPNILTPGMKNPRLEGEILVLKLHGSVGWRKFVYQPCVGIPPEHLEGLGASPKVDYPDVNNRGLATNRTMIVPTWFKTFNEDPLFRYLWQQALEVMRKASEVVVIGYSFPKADMASWVLRQTGAQRQWIWVDCPEGKERSLHDSFQSWMRKKDTRDSNLNERNGS